MKGVGTNEVHFHRETDGFLRSRDLIRRIQHRDCVRNGEGIDCRNTCSAVRRCCLLRKENVRLLFGLFEDGACVGCFFESGACARGLFESGVCFGGLLEGGARLRNLLFGSRCVHGAGVLRQGGGQGSDRLAELLASRLLKEACDGLG